MTPDPITIPEEFASALSLTRDRLGIFAHQILWYPEVGSTNDIAGAMADRGAAEGLVVLADRQTAGRGRLGRSWASPSGAGIYVSVVLRPSTTVATLLTIAAGVAIAEGITSSTGLAPHVKWPNDVHVSGRKLAGILAEGAVGHVVLGIGINVQSAAYPADVASRATSIEAELSRPVDRGLVLAECLVALASRYRELQDGRGRRVVDAWRSRAASMLGRRVEWDSAGIQQVGLAENIDDDGALIVKVGAGTQKVRSGEVRWL
jgi:BirA family transcriptional regulator, biotin operon repressor / biotin---[acetyl-CoA-carboxylase] ligase